MVVLVLEFFGTSRGLVAFLRSPLFSPRKRLGQHCSVTEDDDDHDHEDD
jgi:hypothetical protein